MTKQAILPGLSMPMFPMRPKSGRQITSKTDVKDIFTRIKGGWTVQLKINGDRAQVGVNENGIHVANRHGGWYGLTVDLTEWKQLPAGTLLDGEVFKKKFYPFEVVAYEGQSLDRSTPAEREAKAKWLCDQVGVDWLYEPTQSVLSKMRANMPTIEGVVLKMANTPYIPLSTATRESDTWIKWKWQGA
jgi:ATP-dependent DNA ligase